MDAFVVAVVLGGAVVDVLQPEVVAGNDVAELVLTQAEHELVLAVELLADDGLVGSAGIGLGTIGSPVSAELDLGEQLAGDRQEERGPNSTATISVLN